MTLKSHAIRRIYCCDVAIPKTEPAGRSDLSLVQKTVYLYLFFHFFNNLDMKVQFSIRIDDDIQNSALDYSPASSLLAFVISLLSPLPPLKNEKGVCRDSRSPSGHPVLLRVRVRDRGNHQRIDAIPGHGSAHVSVGN